MLNARMRIAIVSDIHGNGTAFDAVLADLRLTAPDLVFHGGDLADSGSGGARIVDCIRDLRWRGVAGNTDQMMFRPQSLTEFASTVPPLQAMFRAIGESADFARETLGTARLDWLSRLPHAQFEGDLALVHASPGSLWKSPAPEADDAALEAAYQELEHSLVVFGHVHRPFIRKTPGMTVVNSGSVSLPYDGDPRASYLLLDNGEPLIRRVEYDVEKEIRAMRQCGLPHAEWIGRMLRSAAFVMPS